MSMKKEVQSVGNSKEVHIVREKNRIQIKKK